MVGKSLWRNSSVLNSSPEPCTSKTWLPKASVSWSRTMLRTIPGLVFCSSDWRWFSWGRKNNEPCVVQDSGVGGLGAWPSSKSGRVCWASKVKSVHGYLGSVVDRSVFQDSWVWASCDFVCIQRVAFLRSDLSQNHPSSIRSSPCQTRFK